jgi:hypothetical protein
LFWYWFHTRKTRTNSTKKKQPKNAETSCYFTFHVSVREYRYCLMMPKSTNQEATIWKIIIQCIYLACYTMFECIAHLSVTKSLTFFVGECDTTRRNFEWYF